jgi:hypothetical protein
VLAQLSTEQPKQGFLTSTGKDGSMTTLRQGEEGTNLIQ